MGMQRATGFSVSLSLFALLLSIMNLTAPLAAQDPSTVGNL
jgi:hypothetical protein